MKLSQANLVRILTAILTPVGAALTAWGAKAGLQLPGAAVVTVGAGASVAVLLMAWHWLQKHTKVEEVLTDAEKLKSELISAVVAAVPAAGPALSDIESVLATHTQQIVQALGNAVHLPPSAEAIAEEIVKALANQSLSRVAQEAPAQLQQVPAITQSPVGPGPVAV